jgi:MoxR-like ATPase
VNQVLSPELFIGIRNLVSSIRIDPAVIDYAVRLASATRSSGSIETGAGPRGSLALVRCARGRALLEHRDFVIPDDIKALAVPVLMHRISLQAESELEGLDEIRVIENLVSKTEAPRT